MAKKKTKYADNTEPKRLVEKIQTTFEDVAKEAFPIHPDLKKRSRGYYMLIERFNGYVEELFQRDKDLRREHMKLLKQSQIMRELLNGHGMSDYKINKFLENSNS